jgi:hypothetical protein
MLVAATIVRETLCLLFVCPFFVFYASVLHSKEDNFDEI